MQYNQLYTIIFILFALGLCNFNTPRGGDKEILFNGKDLSGWDTYIGPAYDTLQKKFTGPPIGLNRDPDNVFSVRKEDGKNAIRISGERFGGISTQKEFENYHLSLEFKWGTQRWIPRKDRKRDSGVLYHAVAPHGADGGFWMRSHEFQIQEGDCGDYWAVAGAIADIQATKRNEKEYVYDPAGPLLTFKTNGPTGRHCIKNPDREKPSGQWNTLDIYCLGDTSIHMVNNIVTMVLYHLKQSNDGHEVPLTKGKIQIQSEGAEVFYRNIQLESITKIPEKLLQPQ